MQYFKDDAGLKTVALVPNAVIRSPLPSPSTTLGAMARVYNDIGGLIDLLASRTEIDPVAVLAVWLVESGGRNFDLGKPVLRFEVHKFWRYWGQTHAALFDKHFRFGGRGALGKPSKNHAFRRSPASPWSGFHGGAQALEYEVFDFACQIADKERACLSSSFGGPQIMGFNHHACGYGDATTLFDRFGEDARWQVLGFFDFCRSNGLLRDIHDLLWTEFGQRYNGDGAIYGPKLKAVYAKKAAFNALPR